MLLEMELIGGPHDGKFFKVHDEDDEMMLMWPTQLGTLRHAKLFMLPYQPSMVQARDYVPTERCKILSVNPK